MIRYRRLIVVFLLFALVVGLSFLDPVRDAVSFGLDWTKQVIRHHEMAGLALFAVLSAVSAIAFFFSTAVIVPVAVYAWGKPATILILWGSWILGAAASYAIGRKPGRRLLKWIIPRNAGHYEQKISSKANFPMVLLFQIALPSEIPGYVLGALKYHFGKYLGARAIAEIPFAVGAVYLGDSFVRRQYGPLIGIAVGGLLLSAVAIYFFHKRLER